MVAVTLTLHHGTLVVPQLPTAYAHPQLRPDPRTGTFRAAAAAYASITASWRADGLPFVDAACRRPAVRLTWRGPARPAYPHQAAALAAWQRADGRGVVVLPTGAGKTQVALMALMAQQQAALVVVPTLDLLAQWRQVLAEQLEVQNGLGQVLSIGSLGGGSSDWQPLTVATYDSALLQMEFIGARFGLLICDECHHLPAPRSRFIASGSLAPARLGLTATPERSDGGERHVAELLGPICYRLLPHELDSRYLAPYDLERIEVPLSDDEQAEYAGERQLYLGFLRQQGIWLGQPQGWAQFVMRSSQTEVGRRAMRAYRRQRRIALTCRGKVAALWDILQRHRQACAILFTDDNETVYSLSRLFMLPAITCQTRPAERQAILAGLAAGTYAAVITARVLNEGVDVPAASVGVVLAGSGSVREHVQRLGRLLRPRPGKRAVLYELCSASHAERGISARRRQHPAYSDGPGPLC